MGKNKVIVILGTTASGKTDLALAMAKKFHGEIISADSRQVYRGMDIGTGKDLDKYKKNKISYHLIDVVSPKKQFTVADFQKSAYRAIEYILMRDKVPIICGGTGLYIDAVVKGYRFEISHSQFLISKKMRKKLDVFTLEELLEKLKKHDPKTYKTIDAKNRRRVQRALEIFYITGKKKSDLSRATPPPFDFIKIGISYPKVILARRIQKRLQERFDAGLIREVKDLHKNGVSYRRLENFGLEYRSIAKYLQNQMTKSEMKARLLEDIVSFSKRQMTWFKRDKEICWVKSQKEAYIVSKKFLQS